jgi:hypothetical protein
MSIDAHQGYASRRAAERVAAARPDFTERADKPLGHLTT